ncbi:MAG: hypothetical protein PUP92_27570 [Rhizonema sp. PD38]|nr:hypothetical protein [Rhizonema sp. PD38]
MLSEKEFFQSSSPKGDTRSIKPSACGGLEYLSESRNSCDRSDS